MPHPFRFGVQISSFDPEGFRDRIREVEAQGYSTLFCPDHFTPQWDPIAMLAAAASVSERLNVGTLVLDVDYRHPVIHAKAAATLQLLSGGRFEFGLGAGWMKSDYDEAGLAYDSPGVRIERLDEALQICRSMWTNERTSFRGTHYDIDEIAQAAALPAGSSPKVLVGGGGRRLLGLAGRHADIVGINPSMAEGRITATTAADLTPARILEKIGWMRAGAVAAGRDPDAIELNSLVFVVAITDDPSGLRSSLAQRSGMTEDEVARCPLFLTGSAQEIQDRLHARREETGISYVVVQGGDAALSEQFASEIVAPLAGK